MVRALGEAAVAGFERHVNLGGLSAYCARNPFADRRRRPGRRALFQPLIL
jgi:hypothetical protein